MDLVAEYARQYDWRSWPQAYELLPPLTGARVLDLGCGIGDQSRDLAALGAHVVGIDADESLLAAARARSIPGARFEVGDIRAPTIQGPFDGIWATFAAAYCPQLPPVLSRWRSLLRPGGWIALTEVSALLDHDPLPHDTRALLTTFAREAREAGGYDFGMGMRLAGHLSTAGFEVVAHRVLADRELSFHGAADADVLQAWGSRLVRMRALQERARQAGISLEQDLLACLASPGHTTRCSVHFCIARRA
jgi:SAM-dependent methyltransferase